MTATSGNLAEDAGVEDVRLSFVEHGLNLVVVVLGAGDLAAASQHLFRLVPISGLDKIGKDGHSRRVSGI